MFPLVLEEHEEFTLTWNICRATCLRVNLVPVLHCLYLLQSVGQHLWDMHVWNSLTCSYGVQMSCSWLMLWFSWVAKSWFEFCEVHCVVHEKNWRSSRTRFCFAVFHFLTLFFLKSLHEHVVYLICVLLLIDSAIPFWSAILHLHWKLTCTKIVLICNSVSIVVEELG